MSWLLSKATTPEAATFIKKGLMPMSRMLRKIYSLGFHAWRRKRINELLCRKCQMATTAVQLMEMVVAQAAPAIPQSKA